MARVLAAVVLLLWFGAAYAENAAEEGSGPIGTIIFLILFFGSCVGFAWLVWRNEKKAKQKREHPAGRDAGEAEHKA